MKPEEKAEIILWDWLITKGENVQDIYFNRRNKLGWKTFQVKGILRKPDFIIKINDGYSDKYIVVEIKSSKNSKDILDAKKIIDYYMLYVREETKYYIDNQEIPISYFIIGSDSSPKGYLFREETLIDNIKQTQSKSKYCVASKYKIIPRFEGSRTFEIVRSLWNWFKEIRNEYEKKCGLGILIADIDNDFVPKMMLSHYNYNKGRWSQRWWKI